MMLSDLFDQFWLVFQSVISADWFIPLMSSAGVFALGCIIRLKFKSDLIIGFFLSFFTSLTNHFFKS